MPLTRLLSCTYLIILFTFKIVFVNLTFKGIFVCFCLFPKIAANISVQGLFCLVHPKCLEQVFNK